MEHFFNEITVNHSQVNSIAYVSIQEVHKCFSLFFSCNFPVKIIYRKKRVYDFQVPPEIPFDIQLDI